MTLAESWKKIDREGPSHILLDKAGTVEMTVVAKAGNPDLQWDLIYIRNDGWSLGCDFYLAQYAEALHRADWIGVARRGDKKPRPMNFVLDT